MHKALNEPISAKKMVVVDSATQRYVVLEVAEKLKEKMVQHLSRSVTTSSTRSS